MEILIMGGTQFVSSSIAKHMIGKGNEVDIFTRGRRAIDYDGIRNHILIMHGEWDRRVDVK